MKYFVLVFICIFPLFARAEGEFERIARENWRRDNLTAIRKTERSEPVRLRKTSAQFKRFYKQPGILRFKASERQAGIFKAVGFATKYPLAHKMRAKIEPFSRFGFMWEDMQDGYITEEEFFNQYEQYLRKVQK